jgi:DNA polymerase-4
METKVLRKIIHVDMDAFYASIEQRDFPEYRGKPLAVGGSPEGRGGVVATASYEARKFGVRSAMPSKKALQLCPDIIFVRPRFEVYKEVSGRIREIFFRYTDLVEPLSLDEAFMDVTTDKLHIGSAIEIARQIKYAIQNELHLTASAGVSISKFMAKIASEMQKPDGLTFIGPSRVEKFMEQLPVSKFFGVGKVTATARSLVPMSLIEPLELSPTAAADVPPKAPKITLESERFMALHITTVSSVPALPTRIPPVSITLLS